MRTILIIFLSTLLVFAQSDITSLDIESYNYFLKGDYENLCKTADKLFNLGYDYYFLRMRLGILAYNKQLYSTAAEHFQKALSFNYDDPISNEYIYYCYLYSGRYSDAQLFLSNLSNDQKTDNLKYVSNKENYKIFSFISYNTTDPKNLSSNYLYYESIKNTIFTSIGGEFYLSNNFKLNVSYSFFQKFGKFYNYFEPAGLDKTFNQNQLYSKLSLLSYPGLELFTFSHFAFFSIKNYQITPTNQIVTKDKNKTENVLGIGINKNFWKVRLNSNISFSNFANSNQTRGEMSITYLPYSNLNFYLTTLGMYQADKYWGNTYLISQDLGLKMFDNLWLESGLSLSNSFLFSFSNGSLLNNSYTIPAFSLYLNGIFLLNNNLTLYITPNFSKKYNYSWDLLNYYRSDKIITKSTGLSISLIYRR